MFQVEIENFEDWRKRARGLIQKGIHPSDVRFVSAGEQSLFIDKLTDDDVFNQSGSSAARQFTVPKSFLELAGSVAYHRSDQRWHLLYNVLWRLCNAEPQLMHLTSDDDLRQLTLMSKAVRRDAHKMKAFVRFREVEGEENCFVAWHRPDHRIVQLVAPFFARRFSTMHWSILTPDESAHWNQQELTFGTGFPRSSAPPHDQLEEFWKIYYASTFNPARLKIRMMKAEMPVRHWKTLPEAELIDDLIRSADKRVEAMVKHSEGSALSARDFFPQDAAQQDLLHYRTAAEHCQGCPLFQDAHQTVFGEGPETARIVLVGEQPGDQEDIVGKPFVGPAGQILDDALKAAGLVREDLYITNTVKHFKFELRGKRRLHKKPGAREIRACRPWFEAEWSFLQAKYLICLGATAAGALIGPEFRLQHSRGTFVASDYTPWTLATWHPSAILRIPSEEKRAEKFRELVHDLKLVATRAGSEEQT